MIEGKIIRKRGLQSGLGRLDGITQASLKKQMGMLLTEMDGDIKQTISGGARTGRKYKRTKDGKFHTASAPSEAPKTDRGGLVAGFAMNVQVNLGAVVGKLINFSDHAKHVEFKPKSRGGRPFMRPLYKKWLPVARQRFQAAVKASVKKVEREV